MIRIVKFGNMILYTNIFTELRCSFKAETFECMKHRISRTINIYQAEYMIQIRTKKAQCLFICLSHSFDHLLHFAYKCMKSQ